MSDDAGSETAEVYCAIQAVTKAGQRCIGACVRRRVPRAHDEDSTQWALELYDFLDNDQYSNLDSFLVQIGACTVLLPEEMADNSKADSRKVNRILDGRPQTSVEAVKSKLFRRADNTDVIHKLVGKDSHETNVAEVERPLGYQCLGCINGHLKLNDLDADFGTYELRLGSLNAFMRLDSAAVEAVNLLPKADHPSSLGSIYGVLNRCKTRMGQRLLER
jgi:DNA mismatch repair protein MSH2